MLSHTTMNLNTYNVVGIEHLQSGQRRLMGRHQNNFKIPLIPAQTEPGKGNR